MHDTIIGKRLGGLISDLEREFAPLERQPLVVIPKSRSSFEDIQLEFDNFNSFDWNRVTSRDLLENIEPYISLPAESYFFLLPKFFRVVLREFGKTELVDTFFEMMLGRLVRGYGEDEAEFQLTPRQIRLIYTITYDLEHLCFHQAAKTGSVMFLEQQLDCKVD